MATTSINHSRGKQPLDPRPGVMAYLWGTAAATFLVVAAVVWTDATEGVGELSIVASWAIASLAGDLFAVRLGRSVSLTMGLSMALACAMVLSPGQAAIVAALGCLDPRELRGEVSVAQSLFNRGQVSCATAAAALVFHASSGNVQVWPSVLVWSLLALGADFLVNATFIVLALRLRDGTSLSFAFRKLFGADALQTGILYLSLGLMAPVIAVVYMSAGFWGVAASLGPLWIAHTALERSEDLQGATNRLARKDVAIQQATERVVEERRDERRAIAGDLHDEVLPALFKVHLMGQVLKQDLAAGRLLELEDDLPELLSATSHAQRATRQMVSNLRTSPIGSRGLISSIQFLAAQLETAGAPSFELNLAHPGGSERAQLVIYQVAREAMTNAARYSRAKRIVVALRNDNGLLRIAVQDDGVGFDLSTTSSGLPHFGLLLMRERCESVGGIFDIDARLGHGVTITAAIPPDA